MQCFTKKLLRRSLIYLSAVILCISYLALCRLGLSFPCLIYRYFHIECISCGATRAGIAIANLDFLQAIKYNALFALVIYPALFLLVLQDYACAIMAVISKREYRSLIDRFFKTKRLYE